ncbi:MAG: geranylgeranylglyceryl/heptaprenylglyceryl phosphate synthase [Candidatus Zixiibacteriota bacterium]
MPDTIYQRLTENARRQGGCFFLLVDPDRGELSSIIPLAEAAEETGVDAMLVGTSFLFKAEFQSALAEIKRAASVPVILFPGSASQVAPGADAILFMSLISGRNPTYLIEEQVRGAQFVKAARIEAIPTGYMLIESGSYTSVEYVSNTRPIPRGKGDLAAAHALAAQHLGMKLVYLEAGSGARLAVPEKMIEEVAAHVEIPIVVGGGIVTPEDARDKISAGASFVVVGTRFEAPSSLQRLREFAEACHPELVKGAV